MMPKYLCMSASVDICSADEVTPVAPATSYCPEQNAEVTNASDAGNKHAKEENPCQ